MEESSHHKQMLSEETRCMLSPIEYLAINRLLDGAVSGRVEQWPVLIRALNKKGYIYDPKTPCLHIKHELEDKNLDLYCSD